MFNVQDLLLKYLNKSRYIATPFPRFRALYRAVTAVNFMHKGIVLTIAHFLRASTFYSCVYCITDSIETVQKPGSLNNSIEKCFTFANY